MKLQKLHINNYRNFESQQFIFESDIAILVGPNGIGKTNILEAISLLSPGRGLRGARPEEIIKHNEDHWKISALCRGELGEAKLDLSYTEGKKKAHFNDSKIPNSELSNFINIIWLTPQMDGLFLGAPADRRKFLDRIVFSSHSNHASLVSKYEKLQRERMKILESNGASSWLDIIEKEMADLAISITKNRLGIIGRINKNMEEIDPAFPHARLQLDSQISEFLEKDNPMDSILSELASNREKDKYAGRNLFGVQKSDMNCFFEPKNILARNCSTGEQKALLISIILAQQISQKNKPILLLDEIFVHLDENRRKALGEFLLSNKAQLLLTSTDDDIAKYLGGKYSAILNV